MGGNLLYPMKSYYEIIAHPGAPLQIVIFTKEPPLALQRRRPQMLPGGCWDVWRPDTLLSAKAPRIFAAPMTAISSKWRDEAGNRLVGQAEPL